MKHIFTLFAFAIITATCPVIACSNSNEPRPSEEQQTPDGPLPPVQQDTTQQQETPQTPEHPDTPEEPDSPVVDIDPRTYITIGEDFVLECKNVEESASASNILTAIEEYITPLKEYMPQDIYSAITPCTLKYSLNHTGIQYIPQTEETEDWGVIIGNDLKPYKDSLNRGNQPNLITNIFARQYYYETLSDEQKEEIENNYTSVKNKYKKVHYAGKRKLTKSVTPVAYNSAIDYFAEITEAYLGTNNFYPFDIEELQRHDENGFNIMKSIWGEIEIPTNEYGITLPPKTLTQWLQYKETPLDPYYRKYIDANGMPIVASRYVSDSALVQAKEIVIAMLVECPEAQEWMLKDHFRIGIIGYRENVTDMPECSIMPKIWPDTDWDARGRGYGATAYIPLMSCGEENIVKIPNYRERYPTESIMVHEFAHNVEYGLRKYHTEFCNALDAAFQNAIDNNLWVDAAGRKTYSRDNVSEYFAEGVQAWFNTCRMVVAIDGKNTMLKYREQLKEYDPMLYNAIDIVMPNYFLNGYHFDYE